MTDTLHRRDEKRPYWLELAGLVLVLLIGAALRFGWPGVTSFAFDEARLSLIALQMARGGQFASLGMPSSVGVPNLPAAAWIYALPYALTPDPLVASMFSSVLSLLGVVGIWWLARNAWGPWAALIAALFLAATPFSALYARSVWAQNLLAPLAVAWGISAYLGVIRQSRAAVALHVFLAGFIWQVHFAGVALILGTFYFFLRWRWWRQWRAVLIGGALALLALAPFVLHVACCAPQVAEQFGSALGGTAQISLTSIAETVRMALGWDWGYLAAGRWPLPIAPEVTALLAGILLITGLMALVMIVRTPAEAERKARTLVEISLVWLVVSPLFFLRHSTPVFIHYQLAALPAVALIVGAGSKLVRGRGWLLLTAALMAGLVLLWVVQIGGSLNQAGRVENGDGLGTPLSITHEVAVSVPEPVLFFTHGDDPNVDGEVAVFEALWWGRDHRIIQGESLLILPDYPAYLLATLAPFQAWEEIETAGLATAVQEYPRRRDEGPGFIGTSYDGATEAQGFMGIEPVQLANGIQLEGWKARMVGPRLRVSSLWRVFDAPPEGTYQQFHHLRTASTLEGEPFQISDVPVTAHQWRVGDHLIIMGDFFVEPDAEYWVDVGQYMLPDVQRVSRLDDHGDSIRLGPFQLAP